MIQHPIATCQDFSWQDELKGLITSPEVLLKTLSLPEYLLDDAIRASKLFPLRVTPSFVSRMQANTLTDPLLMQVLPLNAEFDNPPDFSPNPLQEDTFNPVKGLVHKYHGRALVITAPSCAINCRYCFRREFNYSDNRLSKLDWQALFLYLKEHQDIEEVILSGGDPLMHSDEHLHWIIEKLAEIPNIERVRLHSRLPIVLPSRVTDALIHAFTSTRLQPIWVVHCNHAQEIDQHVSYAFERAHLAGITLLNQTVLLKGVNDNPKALIELSKCLFKHKVLPYYLHLLDKVSGASHFDITEKNAVTLYNAFRSQISGYLLPKLVREEPGAIAKTPISVT